MTDILTPETVPLVPQGWQCPVCRRCYAPSNPLTDALGSITFANEGNRRSSGGLCVVATRRGKAVA